MKKERVDIYRAVLRKANSVGQRDLVDSSAWDIVKDLSIPEDKLEKALCVHLFRLALLS